MRPIKRFYFSIGVYLRSVLVAISVKIVTLRRFIKREIIANFVL